MAYEMLYNELDSIKEKQGKDIKGEVKSVLDEGTQTVYGYIAEIEPSQKWIYGLAAAVIVFFIAKLRVSTNVIFGLVVAAGAVYMYHEKTRVQSAGANRDLVFKIRALETLTSRKYPYLYTEPVVINFYSKYVDLRKYSSKIYDQSLGDAGLLLKVKHQAEVAGGICTKDQDTARDLMSKMLNAFWSLSRNVALNPEIRGRQQQALRELHAIAVDLMDDMARNCGAGASPLHAPLPIGTLGDDGPY